MTTGLLHASAPIHSLRAARSQDRQLVRQLLWFTRSIGSINPIGRAVDGVTPPGSFAPALMGNAVRR